MTNTSEQKLDAYFKKQEWNHYLPEFVGQFFGHDRTWVFNALKCVLPNTIPVKDLENAAYDLWSYAQHHTLDLEEFKSEKSREKANEVLEDFIKKYPVDELEEQARVEGIID